MIKSYTDLEQSKKLAEILPLETADFGWNIFVDGSTRILPIDDWDLTKDGSKSVKFFHAWSLAALVSVLPVIDLYAPSLKMKLTHRYYVKFYLSEQKRYIVTDDYESPIDACVAMIEKLHEQKLI